MRPLPSCMVNTGAFTSEVLRDLLVGVLHLRTSWVAASPQCPPCPELPSVNVTCSKVTCPAASCAEVPLVALLVLFAALTLSCFVCGGGVGYLVGLFVGRARQSTERRKEDVAQDGGKNLDAGSAGLAGEAGVRALHGRPRGRLARAAPALPDFGEELGGDDARRGHL